MTIESIFSSLWGFVSSILNMEIPLGQYRVTFWNVTIFGFIMYKVLQILFGLGTRGGEE